MCCEKKVIYKKHHAVLVYENVIFAEGSSWAFRSPLIQILSVAAVCGTFDFKKRAAHICEHFIGGFGQF
jgi:hypothetical protein